MANTTASLSEVGVAAMAGNLLDEFNISSLDEDTPLARFMAREFGYVRDEVLQLYPWHPASKRAVLTPVEEAPAFGWTTAYNLPADCIRLRPLKDCGEWNGAEKPFELEAGQILIDHTGPLYIKYIFKLTNISKWRPLMARVLASRLAMYAATRVTGKSSYYQKAAEEHRRVLFEATHADSLERGTPENYLNGETDVFTARGL